MQDQRVSTTIGKFRLEEAVDINGLPYADIYEGNRLVVFSVDPVKSRALLERIAAS